MKEPNGRDLMNNQTSPFSGDRVVEKDASEVRSSLSVAGTCNSHALESVDRISISDSRSLLQNNSSCSPHINLTHKKSLGALLEEVKFESTVTQKLKPMGKDVEAHAALSSFETMLGNLTRTKDSIGRATRVAIECAKFGVGPKVL